MYFDPLDHSRLFAPFRALQMNRSLERLLRDAGPNRSTLMAFALYTRDDGVLLRTPLPGVEAGDIALEVEGNELTISGRFPEPQMAEKAQAQRVERPRGAFSRTLHLPFEVDSSGVEARIERGVLEVQIPRLQQHPPVKIQVLPEPHKN